MSPEQLQVFFEPVSGSPGAISQLRRFVLNLAICGKLDDQIVDDEYVRNILKRARGEQVNTIATKKRARAEQGLAIGIDEIPLPLTSVANFVRLSSVASLRKGLTGIQAAKPGRFPLVVTAENRASCDHFDFDGAAAIIPLVSSTGHGDASLKRIHYQDGKFALGNILCGVFPLLAEEVTARFLFEYLDAFKDELLVSRMVGTANVSLTTAKIAEIPVPIVSIKAQQTLGELMKLCDALEARGRLADAQHARLTSTLFDALAASESAHALAENWQRIAEHFDLLLDRPEAIDALEQTILHLGVRGLLVSQVFSDEPAARLLKKIRDQKQRLVDSGDLRKDRLPARTEEFDPPFSLPENWEWAKLSDISTRITDGVHHTPQYIAKGVPFLSVKNLSAGKLDFEDTRFISPAQHADLIKRCDPELGDVLLTKIGTTGIAVVIDDPRPFSIFVSVALIKLPPRLIDRNYLCLVINSPFVRKQSQDGTEGVGNKNLVLRKINAFNVPIPPLNEQRRIVARVEELRHLCAQLRERLTSARRTQSQLAEALVAEVA